jgi:hypothetical protein
MVKERCWKKAKLSKGKIRRKEKKYIAINFNFPLSFCIPVMVFLPAF